MGRLSSSESRSTEVGEEPLALLLLDDGESPGGDDDQPVPKNGEASWKEREVCKTDGIMAAGP